MWSLQRYERKRFGVCARKSVRRISGGALRNGRWCALWRRVSGGGDCMACQHATMPHGPSGATRPTVGHTPSYGEVCEWEHVFMPAVGLMVRQPEEWRLQSGEALPVRAMARARAHAARLAAREDKAK